MSRRGGGRRGGGRGRGAHEIFTGDTQPVMPAYGRGGAPRGAPRGRGDHEIFTGDTQPVMPAYGRGGAPRGAPRGRGGPMPEASHAPSPVQEMEQLSLSSIPGASAQMPTVPPSSSKAVTFPVRPGFGSLGRKCVVRANHFLVQIAENDLFHYDVAISPEQSSRGTNRLIISELVNAYQKSFLGGKLPVYDGRKSLYTAGEFPFKSKDFITKLPNKDQKERGESGKEREFRVAIKLVGRADVHHLNEFLRGRQLDTPLETIQALDVVLRESPNNKYTIGGRSFFSLQFGHGGDLGDGVECWRGYYQSLRPTQMGLSLNVDSAATSFYKGMPVLDFVMQFLNLRDVTRPLSDRDRIKLKKILKGVRVEATHRPQNFIRYRITDVTRVPMENLTFPMGEEQRMISVVGYFKEQYHYNLRHTRLPCLQAGNDKKIMYLPMEVCNIIPGQKYLKKLNEKQVTAMLKACCKRPIDREKNILEVVQLNRYNEDNYAREFGLRVSNQMVSVDARVLTPPKLKYHESGKDKTCTPQVGQWNMIGKKMINGGTVDRWACVSFSRMMNQNDVTRFCNDLVSMCNTMGMVFNPRPCMETTVENANNIEGVLRKVHQLIGKIMSNRCLELLIIILPDFTGSYGKIKKICETELGIITQCLQFKKLSRGGYQYQENVALKINVKVGGRNNVLEDALYGKVPYIVGCCNSHGPHPTIIFGADVTHPSPGEDSSPSIAAVVASMDWPEVTKYKGLISAQTRREEMITDMYSSVEDPQKVIKHGGMIRELLISFYKSTGQKPHRIIFYRDGVSEGQFSHVLMQEMDKIRKACASLEEGYLPPVTFVVVQKRHHTRLFPEVHGRRDSTDRSGNILPGTVVDTKICHPTQFDFYLCSHAGIQGTSRPTHYHVLYDENKFSADALQTLTNNLCYTYARCTRSVSIVPPVYYAHLAAFRARYYMDMDQPEASSSAGERSRERQVEIYQLPKIKENVKEVMFYC